MTTFISFGATLGQALGPTNAQSGVEVHDGPAVASGISVVNTASADAATADTDAGTATTDCAALIAYMGTVGLTGTLESSVTLTAAQGNSLIAAANLVSTDLATVKTDTAATATATGNAVTAFSGADVTVNVNATNVNTVTKLDRALEFVLRRAKGNSSFTK